MEDTQEMKTQQTEAVLSRVNMSPPTEDVRTHSNLTLEQAIARQQADQQQASQHRPPQIVPRPTVKSPAPQDSPPARTPGRKAAKSTLESKPKEHQNKCPAQGTRE